jgi:cytoskeletal protein RodZ
LFIADYRLVNGQMIDSSIGPSPQNKKSRSNERLFLSFIKYLRPTVASAATVVSISVIVAITAATVKSAAALTIIAAVSATATAVAVKSAAATTVSTAEAAATAATVESTAAATEAFAFSAFLTLTSSIHHEVPAVNVATIQRVDCFLTFFLVLHLDKTKAFRSAGSFV